MRGRIVGIEISDEGEPTERIQFDIELKTTINPAETGFMPLTVLDNPDTENSVVRFCVNKIKSTDEDDVNTASTIVLFQIAYAVSIHKAQGLEYSSVKLVITDKVDELITHNIFYTAITRAQHELKIYWTPEVEKKVLQRIQPQNIDSDVEILRKFIKEAKKTTHKGHSANVGCLSFLLLQIISVFITYKSIRYKVFYQIHKLRIIYFPESIISERSKIKSLAVDNRGIKVFCKDS